jgi:Ni,Fe-hydrogenase I small subunit
MPYRYTIDSDARLVTVVGEGLADLGVTGTFMRTLLADREYRPDLDLLVDARTLDYTPTLHEAQEIRTMLHDVRESYRGRIAVVVDGTVRFGMARMVSTLVEPSGIRMEAFRDLATARAWLSAR